MAQIFWAAGIILVLGMGFVVFFGPPYLPTLGRQAETALDLLDLKPGQTLLDLGSGDGRVLRAAAKRGINAVGIELNPFLVVFSRLYNWRYRKNIRVICGSYWRVQWPPADAIFTFMLPRSMAKLDRRIESWHTHPTRLASHAFMIPGKKPATTKAGVHIYFYK